MLYVTERCVFQLRPDGLELAEAAPGIDVERDILAHMEFQPIVKDVRPMDPRILLSEPMGLRDRFSISTSPIGWPTTPSATSCSSTSKGSMSAGPRT